MQGWETGVRAAALQLHKQSFFGWTGEVPSPFEGPISAPRAFILLKDIFKSFHVLQVCTLQMFSLFYSPAETTYLVPQTDRIKYHVCK